jgi:O-antigen ligase
MIATAIGLMIFFLLYYRAKFVLLIPIFTIIILVFGVSFFQAKGYWSFLSRFYLLLPAFQMITFNRNRLFWGYGISNALVEYKKNLVVFSPEDFTVNDPHNTYVTLILMLGVVLTVILLIFAFVLISKAVKRVFSERDPKEILLNIFLVSSACSILVQGLFDAELVKIDYYTIHYLLILFGMMYLIQKGKFISRKNVTPSKLSFLNY